MNFDTVSVTSPQQLLKPFFEGMSDEMQECIQNCMVCSEVCEQLVQPCLSKGGAYATPEFIRCLQDCSDVCSLHLKMMMRHSEAHVDVARICASVCEACVQAGQRFQDDDLMKACIEICQRCQSSCERMSTMH